MIWLTLLTEGSVRRRANSYALTTLNSLLLPNGQPVQKAPVSSPAATMRNWCLCISVCVITLFQSRIYPCYYRWTGESWPKQSTNLTTPSPPIIYEKRTLCYRKAFKVFMSSSALLTTTPTAVLLTMSETTRTWGLTISLQIHKVWCSTLPPSALVVRAGYF